MTISDEISIIANKLANDGKTPSVALIKSRLNQHAPLPKIIAVLKSWQHDPTFISSKNVETLPKAPTALLASNQDINLLIANALAPLQQEIAELKLQVNLLIEKQK
jgi:hypothetical protein